MKVINFILTTFLFLETINPILAADPIRKLISQTGETNRKIFPSKFNSLPEIDYNTLKKILAPPIGSQKLTSNYCNITFYTKDLSHDNEHYRYLSNTLNTIQMISPEDIIKYDSTLAIGIGNKEFPVLLFRYSILKKITGPSFRLIHQFFIEYIDVYNLKKYPTEQKEELIHTTTETILALDLQGQRKIESNSAFMVCTSNPSSPRIIPSPRDSNQPIKKNRRNSLSPSRHPQGKSKEEKPLPIPKLNLHSIQEAETYPPMHSPQQNQKNTNHTRKRSNSEAFHESGRTTSLYKDLSNSSPTQETTSKSKKTSNDITHKDKQARRKHRQRSNTIDLSDIKKQKSPTSTVEPQSNEQPLVPSPRKSNKACKTSKATDSVPLKSKKTPRLEIPDPDSN